MYSSSVFPSGAVTSVPPAGSGPPVPVSGPDLTDGWVPVSAAACAGGRLPEVVDLATLATSVSAGGLPSVVGVRAVTSVPSSGSGPPVPVSDAGPSLVYFRSAGALHPGFGFREYARIPGWARNFRGFPSDHTQRWSDKRAEGCWQEPQTHQFGRLPT